MNVELEICHAPGYVVAVLANVAPDHPSVDGVSTPVPGFQPPALTRLRISAVQASVKISVRALVHAHIDISTGPFAR